MSFIRPGSNPEGLYIIGGRHGRGSTIEFLFPERNIIIPWMDFRKLCLKWRNGQEKIKIKDLSLKEVWVYEDNNEVIPQDLPLNLVFKKNARSTAFKIKLSYKDWYVYMWQVTWEYIVNNVLRKD